MCNKDTDIDIKEDYKTQNTIATYMMIKKLLRENKLSSDTLKTIVKKSDIWKPFQNILNSVILKKLQRKIEGKK